MAAALADVALLTDVIGGYDQRDTGQLCPAAPRYVWQGRQADAPVTPDLAWFDLPFNDRLSDDARDGLEAVLEILGPQVRGCSRPTPCPTWSPCRPASTNMKSPTSGRGVRHPLGPDQRTLKPIITRARKITRAEYEDALAVKASAEAFFADFFIDFDAIIAPSAAGEAPKFGDGTGDPIFCTLWTLAGLPCVSTAAVWLAKRTCPSGCN